MRKSSERKKYERYQKRINAKVKPRVYGIGVYPKTKIRKTIEGLAPCWYFLIFWGSLATVVALMVTFGNDCSHKSEPENNSTLSNC